MSGNEILKIRDIRSKIISNTISVEGKVSAIEEVHPKLKTVAYMCDKCEFVMYLPVEGSKVGKPVHCENEWCGNKSGFTLLEKKSSRTDSQHIWIEELNPIDPRSLLVYLEGDLVDTVHVKDKIVVTGVLKADFKSTSTTGDFVIEANSIEKYKEKIPVTDNKARTDSREVKQVILDIIERLSSSSPHKASLEDVYREASNLHIRFEDAEKGINKLTHQGDLLFIDKKHIKIV
ncbi:minichromosome maintenance protein MCM [Methanococcoides sp. SA1]|nr:minichromosome maintenance protein MCM [Methanococcoides sp. SA1]